MSDGQHDRWARGLQSLREQTGIPQEQIALLVLALTHTSYANEHPDCGGHNERLEFLGDAVLDLLVGERLMQRSPDASEGLLSKHRSAVVNEGSLATLARELNLGAQLRLGRGEERSGGREKASLLSDAFEAVVAAIYLSSGLESARSFALALFEPLLVKLDPLGRTGDFKTRLQELTQGRYREAPTYRLMEEHGPDHDKRFVVEVRLGGKLLGVGEGRSKKEAEQAAATSAFGQLADPARR